LVLSKALASACTCNQTKTYAMWKSEFCESNTAFGEEAQQTTARAIPNKSRSQITQSAGMDHAVNVTVTV
jgi:hypothetical protein